MTLALFGVAAPVLAYQSVPMLFKDLYARAKVIAVVEVLEKTAVMADGATCGARYKGRVVDSIRHASAGAVFEFGYIPSLKVGTAYLMFLSTYEDVPVDPVPEFQSRCRAALPSAAIVAHWRGAMEIVGDTSTPRNRDSWTVRPPSQVVFPAGTRTTAVNGEKRYWLNDLLRRGASDQ